jgi:hypothetical protein
MADAPAAAANQHPYTKMQFLFFDGGPAKAADELSYEEWKDKMLMLHPQYSDFLTRIINVDGNLPANRGEINSKLFQHIYLNTRGLASSIVREYRAGGDGKAALAALDDKFLPTDAARIEQHLTALTTMSLAKNQDIDDYILKARFHVSELERSGVTLTDVGAKVYILTGLPAEYDNVRDNLRSQADSTMDDLRRVLRARFDYLRANADALDCSLPPAAFAARAPYHGGRAWQRNDQRQHRDGADASAERCPLHPNGTHHINACRLVAKARALQQQSERTPGSNSGGARAF